MKPHLLTILYPSYFRSQVSTTTALYPTCEDPTWYPETESQYQGGLYIKNSMMKFHGYLGSLALNGREVSSTLLGIYHLLTAINQIKNIAAVAHALAEADKRQVSYKFLKLAAESIKKFSEEFGRQGPVGGMYV